MDIEMQLHDLGLGKNDVKAYLALINHGRLGVQDIAAKSGVHRVNVYDALRSLEQHRLISRITLAKKEVFQAENPQRLKDILKEKEDRLNKIIPLLQSPFTKVENKSQNFEGIEAIKRMLEDMLVLGEPIQAFGIPARMPELLGGYLNTFHRKRIERRTRIQHIYNENAKERIAHLNKLKGSEAKYLPPEYSVPATTVIYGNKVAFWIWSEVPFSVLVESKDMADAYRKYFTLLWKIAK